ncbi:MAG: hypothetical protein ABL995_10055 [Bryobacteraceae bacterium]
MKWMKSSFLVDWWHGRIGSTGMGRHLTDEELLFYSDGEMRALDARRTRLHLEECWICRARQKQFAETIVQFTDAYQEVSDGASLQGATPLDFSQGDLAQRDLAQLDARQNQDPLYALQEPAAGKSSRHSLYALICVSVLACTGFLAALLLVKSPQRTARSIPWQTASLITPDSRITPGAAVRYNRDQVCGAASENNRQVPPSLRREVLAAYGIGDAEPRSYEVDYLITPALGGADDIRNMWPQTYSAEWNARVKDELEDRLRQMVCSGDLDLDTAQSEISNNWIEAYKKYFHTDRPMEMR